jgi:hypothetical protein
MRKYKSAMVLTAALAACAGRAFAAPGASSAGATYFDKTMGPWEFGVDIGLAYPTRKGPSFTHVIDNQCVYDLLADETVGDEVAEGFIAPPLPGSSLISASMRSSLDVGMHIYRRWTPSFAWGLDAGWVIKRDTFIDNRGIFRDDNFLKLHDDASIIHVSLPVKIGPEFRGVRPYLLAGPGVYIVQERATASFNDSDDPQVKPLEIVHRDGLHLGVFAGVGVEERFASGGLIGLEVQYHKIFASRDRVDFIEPRLRLGVAF